MDVAQSFEIDRLISPLEVYNFATRTLLFFPR